MIFCGAFCTKNQAKGTAFGHVCLFFTGLSSEKTDEGKKSLANERFRTRMHDFLWGFLHKKSGEGKKFSTASF